MHRHFEEFDGPGCNRTAAKPKACTCRPRAIDLPGYMARIWKTGPRATHWLCRQLHPRRAWECCTQTPPREGRPAVGGDMSTLWQRRREATERLIVSPARPGAPATQPVRHRSRRSAGPSGVRAARKLDQPEPDPLPALVYRVSCKAVEMGYRSGTSTQGCSITSGPSILTALRRTAAVERGISSAIEERCSCPAPCHPGS